MILSSVEKTFDEKFCPTVSEGMCMEQHFKNDKSFFVVVVVIVVVIVQAFFLLPKALGAMIHIQPIPKAEIH